jgi:hypothetical protein
MTITIYNSEVYGSTEDFHGDVEVYGNTQIDPAIDDHCPEE